MKRFLTLCALSAALIGPFLCWGLAAPPPDSSLPAPVATSAPPVPTEPRVPPLRPVPIVTLPASVVPAVTPTP